MANENDQKPTVSLLLSVLLLLLLLFFFTFVLVVNITYQEFCYIFTIIYKAKTKVTTLKKKNDSD